MIALRGFEAGDEEAFLTLYRACLDHYGVARPGPAGEGRILVLLAQERHMSALLAWDGDTPLGFATWALTFPAGPGVALYLKELFVASSARGRGLGRALLAGLIDIAEAEGCTRFDWQTDATNMASQRFYASLDAPRFDKATYRIPAGDFTTFRAKLMGTG